MNSTRFLYWGAQFFGWMLYGALVVLSMYAYYPKSVDHILFIEVAVFIGCAIVCTHVMRKLFFKWNWLDMKLSPLIPRIILASFICSILLSITPKLLFYFLDFKTSRIDFEIIDKEPISLLKLFNAFISNSVLLLFWNALYFTYHFFSKSRKQELSNLSLESSRNEIELKNLRSQLNPHFLFNSLNSIRALIEIEPLKAKKSVTALSNLLRKSLMMGKQNLTTIADEIEMVSNYLDLEKIRFEERLVVCWDLDESLNEFLIPPFSIQMLVENAIKHGISNLINGGEISIKTMSTNDTISIIVKNSGSLKKEIDLGIGIENTRRRLDLQFQGSANLEIHQEGDSVVSSITFKK